MSEVKRSQIAPSILSFSHANLKDDLLAMERAGVGIIHLDVMDGQFVPPITFGDGLAKSVRTMIQIPFEAHLMTLNPERQIDAFASAGCHRFIFHAESTYHSHHCIQLIHKAGMEAGIALNPGTDISTIEPVIDLVDLVLIMTVNPGYGGQKFLPETMPKVRGIRSRNKSVLIEVDGGIDPSTIQVALDSGANLFVVGSFLQKPSSIEEAVKMLTSGKMEK